MFSTHRPLRLLSFVSQNIRCFSANTNPPNAVQLAYTKTAARDVDFSLSPLLIFHGLFGSKTNWKSISNQLATRTRREVYAIDLRNHGESPHTRGDQTMLRDMASDIQLFMEDRRMEAACLLGHSLGGRVCSQFAFDNPVLVEKLILADISPLAKTPKTEFLNRTLFADLRSSLEGVSSSLPMVEGRKAVGEKLMQTVKNKFVVDFMLLSLYKDSKSGEFRWRFCVDALEQMIREKNITKVTVDHRFEGQALIIHGADSPYIEVEDYGRILAKMPKAQFVKIANAGHYLHVERPQEFLDAVVRFLNSEPKH